MHPSLKPLKFDSCFRSLQDYTGISKGFSSSGSLILFSNIEFHTGFLIVLIWLRVLNLRFKWKSGMFVRQTDTSRSQRSQEAAEPEVAVNEVSFVQPVGFHCRDDNGECQNQVQDGNGTHPQNQAIQIEFDQEAVSPPWYEDKPSTVVPPDKLILKASDAVPLRAPASTAGM